MLWLSFGLLSRPIARVDTERHLLLRSSLRPRSLRSLLTSVRSRTRVVRDSLEDLQIISRSSGRRLRS